MANVISLYNETKTAVKKRLVLKAVAGTLKKQKVTEQVLVSVTFVGDRKMTKLHRKYLGIGGTTDVLSFPINELKRMKTEEKQRQTDENGKIELGDIFVCLPQAKRQAVKHKIAIDQEVQQLVEHGVLHLLGIHHE